MNIALKVVNARDLKRPAGRFVVEFDDGHATGVTGAEVAELIESGHYPNLKLYRIHRAYPDGRMELVGIDKSRWQLEDGLLFWRADVTAARADLEALRSAAVDAPPPCRARVQLAKMPGAMREYVIAMLYPAEYGDDMSAWLQRIGFMGGDFVEGGVSHAANYAGMTDTLILDRVQLWGTDDGTLAEQDANAAGDATDARGRLVAS